MRAPQRVFYACKANPHPEILRRLEKERIGFECVSPGELHHVRKVLPHLSPDRILFTPNFAPKAEYEEALHMGVHVTVDALWPLERWPEIFAGREILLRLDPGRGRGHHAHVRTAGAQSKFGIAQEDLPALAALAAKAGVRVVGLHAHAGSGIRQPETWQETALFLAQARDLFPDIRYLDVGGGLGIPEKPGHSPLNLESVDQLLLETQAVHPDLEIWLEPGRYLAARCGVLLANVTQLKNKGEMRYVGVNVGMNSLIRPALYGSYHEIVNLSRWGQPAKGSVQVVGPICETGDTLGYARRLPYTDEGDVLLIANAGAYGHSMSSSYNLRPPASEVFLAIPPKE